MAAMPVLRGNRTEMRDRVMAYFRNRDAVLNDKRRSIALDRLTETNEGRIGFI